MKTSGQIGINFGTVDYIHKICPQTKFGDNHISEVFWGNIWENVKFSGEISYFIFPNQLGGHTQPIFIQNGLND